MFKRKLQALDYPAFENVNISNEKEYRSIILWLEDQKIRHYKIDDRQALRNIESADWQQAFDKYKIDIMCPIKSGIANEELQWFLAFAVRLEYADNSNYHIQDEAVHVNTIKTQLLCVHIRNNNISAVNSFILEIYYSYSLIRKCLNIEDKYRKKPEVLQSNAPNVVAVNALDNLDFTSTDFKNGINALAKILKISQHPDHLITLKAVRKVVSKRLNPDALAHPERIIIKGAPFPFQDANLGFDLGDNVLNHAAKILRLLYIQNQRQLQTNINELIVAVQSVTANPKTDTKIGQVGR